MGEIIALVRGQLLDKEGEPYLCPVLAETPSEVVDFLLPRDGDWWIRADGKDIPLLRLDLVWMEREEFENLRPWEG